MKYRSLVILFAVFLLMLMPATIGAQDLSETELCFGLSEEDCMTLDAASDNIDSYFEAGSSFTLEFDFDLSVQGLSEDMPLPLPPEIMGMLEGRSSAVLNAAGSIDVVIGDDGELQTVGAIMDVEMGEVDDDLVTVPVEIRIVDDYIYIGNPNTGEWQGASLDIDETDAEQMAELEALPINPATGELNIDILGDMPSEEAIQNINMEELVELPGLATQVREGDDFTLTVDFSALSELLEPNYADLYEEIAASLSAIDQNLAFMFVMLPSIPFEEGELVITQHVDTENNIVDSVDISLALNVNLMQFMGQPDGEPIIIYLDVAADFVNVGSAPAAVAPAEFEEVPLTELFGGM